MLSYATTCGARGGCSSGCCPSAPDGYTGQCWVCETYCYDEVQKVCTPDWTYCNAHGGNPTCPHEGWGCGCGQSSTTPPTSYDPVGYFDFASCPGAATGWACDQSDFNAALNVEIYIDGSLYTTITANYSRADVAGSCGNTSLHGFNWSIPAALYNGSAHTIYVKAKNTGSGNDVTLAGNPGTKTFTCSPPQLTVTPPAGCATSPATYIASFSWTGAPNPSFGFWVDISPNVDMSGYSNKNVSSTTFSTTGPSGFNPAISLYSGTTYYARVFNGSHSPVKSFKWPICPTPTPTSTFTPTPTPTTPPTVPQLQL